MTATGEEEDAAAQKHESAAPKRNAWQVLRNSLWQPTRDGIVWSGRIIRKFFDGLNYISPLLTAVATVGVVWVAYWQWDAMDQTWKEAKIAAEISRRAEITTTDWQGIFRKNHAPVISLSIKNAGLTHAHIVRVTYEYSISQPLPNDFGPVTDITEKFGMLGPDNKVFVGISNIRPLNSDEFKRFESGQLFVYTRIIVFYQDIFAQTYRNRFTARFGMLPDRSGALAVGFDFPEFPTSIENWGDGAKFRNFRCLNYHERWAQNADPDCDKKQSGGAH